MDELDEDDDVVFGVILEQVGATVDVMRRRMKKLFDDVQIDHGLPGGARADDLADIVVRTALSHYLIPSSDRGRLLRELRAVAGVGSLARR